MTETKKEDVAVEGGKPPATPKGKKDKDGSDEQEVQVIVDPRINWFEDRVVNALKIKNDKWKKMISSIENLYVLCCFNFLFCLF